MIVGAVTGGLLGWIEGNVLLWASVGLACGVPIGEGSRRLGGRSDDD